MSPPFVISPVQSRAFLRRTIRNRHFNLRSGTLILIVFQNWEDLIPTLWNWFRSHSPVFCHVLGLTVSISTPSKKKKKIAAIFYTLKRELVWYKYKLFNSFSYIKWTKFIPSTSIFYTWKRAHDLRKRLKAPVLSLELH